MTGAQHLTASTGLLLISHTLAPKIEPIISKGYGLIHQHYTTSDERTIILASGMTLLYYLGTLLPDIDLQGSTITRLLHFHLPITHRTWTHAIWIPLLIFIASLKIPVLLGLTLGYMAHLICDAFSSQGICFLYPFTQYIHFYNGAKIKNHHYIRLYDSQVPSTGWIMAAIILVIGVTLTLVNHGISFSL